MDHLQNKNRDYATRHDHQLRRKTLKKYNLSSKLLDNINKEILISQDQQLSIKSTKATITTYSSPEENPLKIKLNLKDITREEKLQQKLRQKYQMQLMQESYIKEIKREENRMRDRLRPKDPKTPTKEPPKPQQSTSKQSPQITPKIRVPALQAKKAPEITSLDFDTPNTENIIIKKKVKTESPAPPPVVFVPLELWSQKVEIKHLNEELVNMIKSGQAFKKHHVSAQFLMGGGNKKIPDEFLHIDELKFNHMENIPSNSRDQMETLEIVNNLNQKIKITIPSKPQSYNWKKLYEINNIEKDNNDSIVPTQAEFYKLIPNHFDASDRTRNFEHGDFRKSYQSGYNPVALQLKEQKEEENQTKKATHFIRQKQSQANLQIKRSCGVSYVKESESQQLNVDHIFKKLPPLMFQCSSSCQPVEGYNQIFEDLNDQIIMGKYTMICVLLQNVDEEIVRDYLLHKNRRLQIAKNKIYLIKEFKDIWMLALDQTYIMIHLEYDHHTLLKGFESSPSSIGQYIVNSDVIICLQFKRSLTGRKAFLKSVNLSYLNQKKETTDPQPVQDVIPEGKLAAQQQLIDIIKKDQSTANLYTYCIRLEMVVTEQKWNQAESQTKNILASFIQYVENKICTQLLVRMMNRRLKAFKNGIKYLEERVLKKIRVLDVEITPESTDTINWNNTFSKETLSACLSMKKRYLCLDSLKQELEQISKPLQIETLKKVGKDISYLENPLYCISTRDSFAYDLVAKTEHVMIDGRRVKKTEYFFDPQNCPNNFAPTFLNLFPDYRVGLVSYDDYFTHEELTEIENKIFETEVKAFNGVFMPQTAQVQIGATVGQVPSVRRTKFFFGYRYMWTKCQLAEPHSMVAAGVRRDVSETPLWMKDLVVDKLEDCGIIPKNFINSIACNVYHDGKEGLAQHFDDAVRFRQPIFTLRTFSDCRLSFGSQYYGFCNGAFAVPLPRGCILVMEEESYAANGVKHCVRPCDMTGKSAAIILRQMHHQVTSEAEKYDELVDFPGQFSTLSMNENAIPYNEQKRLEAEMLLANK